MARVIACMPVLLLLACGPSAPAPGGGSSSNSGSASDDGSASADDSTAPAAPTTGASTTGASTTGGSTDAASTSSGADTGTASTTETTGASVEPPTCNEGCEHDDSHCPLAAQVNAAVAGMTPLGAFDGTFAAFNGALVLGWLGTLVVVPEYSDGPICELGPRLLLDLGPVEWEAGESFVVEAPARFTDAGGVSVDTVAQVQVKHCCNQLWFCSCQSDKPFDVEISITAEGWSLTGTAAPNCCRSFSIDEAA